MHHLCRVLRVRPGDALEILDSDSPDLIEATVESLPEKALVLTLHRKIIRPKPPAISVALGLPATPVLETLFEKLTELEVSELLVFFASASQHQQQLERLEQKLERFERIRDGARLQSGSRTTLKLSVFEDLNSLLNHLETKPLKLLLSLARPSPNLLHTLNKNIPVEAARISVDGVVMVGPEGGFRTEEEEQALKSGFVRVSLGESTLRTETAAVAAVAVIRSWLAC